MKKLSDEDPTINNIREKLLGLGENSLRKSYYPELQRQLENVSEQLELAKLVAEVAQALAVEKNLKHSLQHCTDCLVQRTEAVFVRIWTVNAIGDFLELQASSGLHTNINGDHSRLSIKDYPYKVGLIARNKESLLCNQVAEDNLFHDQEWIKEHRISTFAGYPLIVESELVGVVAIFAERSFRTVTLDALSTIISQIAVGIERKRAERALAEHKDKLELLVEERTQQLKKAQEELLQNERLTTLGRLTATVSHELRNPLGTIQTAIDSLDDSLQRKDFSQINRVIELAERNIDRCINIIEDLTDYTRVKKLKIDSVFLDAWLEKIISELDVPAEIECGLVFNCDAKVQIDSEKIRQVIVNLVNNAIDAIKGHDERRAGKIIVSTQLLDGQYEVSIQDNGVGMSSEVLNQVFEPLFSTKGFGVGLGMVIVKNIIERHKGEISIQSKEGVGTSITIKLPLLVSY